MQFGSNEKLFISLFSGASFISGVALTWGLNNQELTATRQDNKAMRLELAAMQDINSQYQTMYNYKLDGIKNDISDIKKILGSGSVAWVGKYDK